MQMPEFANKNQMRTVYGFGDTDPAFEIFYEGFSALAHGDPKTSYQKFEKILSIPNFNPVYRYAIIAMFESGTSYPDIQKITEGWITRAVESENETYIADASAAFKLIMRLSIDPSGAETALKTVITAPDAKIPPMIRWNATVSGNHIFSTSGHTHKTSGSK